jgi:very-short-patch-repair endonuclease
MSPTRSRPPAAVVSALGGRATWQQLRGLCTQHAIRRDLDRGFIVRARQGVYVLPDLPSGPAVAARLGGVVSHLSAAIDHGLAVLVRPETVHVTVPPSSSVSGQSGVTLHYAALPAREVRALRTTLARTVIDCAITLTFREGLAVADSAVREGFLRPEDLLEAAQVRRGSGRRRALRVAMEADGEAANPFESALRAAVLDAGVSGFRPQQRVALATGVVRVDLGDPARRIALEADSFAHHGSRTALRDDCHRYDELVRAGWIVLRFAWEHVVLQPEWVGEVVRDTCGRRAA